MSKVAPRYRWYRHCEVLADVLQRVADGRCKRLMIFMPPRHSKSESVSRLFSAYFLHRYPHRWVGLNSYGADLAYTLSRAARQNYEAGGGRIKDDVAAVKQWETPEGGGMWAAGVGGPITGKGFDLGIIDDPVKNAEEAASETIRAKQEEWYKSTFYTREEPAGDGEPDGAIVIVQTRWNALDLSGWLLAQEGSDDDEPERWHVVSLAAIKEDEPPELPATCTVEPDWRAVGEALCPERRPVEKLNRIRARIGSYFWSSLYAQRPGPREGGFFKWAWFADRVVDAAPVDAERIRYWDTAGTENGGDYTAGVRMARAPDGIMYVEDVVRGQWSPGRRDQNILETTVTDGKAVKVWLEKEAGVGGEDRTAATVRLLAGYSVRSERPTGEKTSRADPFAAWAEAGNVRLVRGPWNKAYLDELCAFPTGAHDDQCLIARTTVATERGLMPIEKVLVGDQVLTRYGPRRVLWSGGTGRARELVTIRAADGSAVVGTPGHPVWVDGVGFRPMGSIAPGDRILTWSGHCNPVSCERSSSSTGAGSSAIPSPHGRPIGDTTEVPGAVGGRLTIEPSGSSLTVPSRPATTSIIATGIGSTTASTTSNAFPPANTFRSTVVAATSRLLSRSSIWPRFARRPPTGIDPRRAESGIGSMPSRGGSALIANGSRSLVPSAGRSSPATSTADSDSVRPGARSAIATTGNRLRWSGTASVAASRSRPRPAVPPHTVAVPVLSVTRESSDVPVFNLTVEGDPEFFANGILVHNCDASAGAFARLAARRKIRLVGGED